MKDFYETVSHLIACLIVGALAAFALFVFATLAHGAERKQACTILWAGLGGPGMSPGLYKTAEALNRLPRSRARVVPWTEDANFERDCQIKVVVGHSLGVKKALEKTEVTHVDLLVSYDGMGFDFNKRSRAARNIYVLAASGGGFVSARGRVLHSPYLHAGVDSDKRSVIVRAVRALQ